ncbi:MAG: DNA-binding protein WhiA [Clostridia bacterium]|jgi:hypothetical protein|nr:DNA-binding protein WhiA [Clostridia bacterium]
MNYSAEAKKQICESAADKNDISLLSAVVHTCAVVRKFSGGFELRLTSNNEFLAPLVRRIVDESAPGCFMENDGKEMIIGGETMALMNMLGIVNISVGGEISFVRGIKPALVKSDAGKKAYLKGAFLGAGSFTASSWHLEIGVASEELAADLAELIKKFGLTPHCFKRKDKHIVYLKRADDVIDFFGVVGASKVMLELAGKLAVDQTRRDSARITNLELSNMDRTINVAVAQVEAIRLIESKVGLHSLNDKLYEVAKLRLSEDTLSYEDIAERLSISKGSVKYRLRKIEEEARRLRLADGGKDENK